jgi:alpha-D-ribose 1-methylphosphonate 5-triphosphate diphosphatase PhnM
MSQNAEQQAPLRITVSEIKSLLDQGKSRKEIAEYFNKTQAEMQRMVWSNPKLKNLKAKKQYTGIELIDDEEDTIAAVETVQEVEAVPAAPGEEVAEVPEDAVNQDWN